MRTVTRPTKPVPAAGKPPFDCLWKHGWYALCCPIFLFYLWTATSSNRPFHPRDTSNEFYNQLTDSLLQGHPYLAARPSPQLLALKDPYDPWLNEHYRLHDASLYRGRYYVYFGVAPAVVLYVPWRLLTGQRVSDDIAVTLFSAGGCVFSCLLLFLLLKAAEVRVPWFLSAAAVCALGLGQMAPVVLRRPRVYEVAVSAGYCFLLGGVYFLVWRVLVPNAWRWLPGVAAVFFGLATASRPHCGLVAAFASALYGVHLYRVGDSGGGRWLREFARFAIPLALAGGAIGWYNYIRFDNPLEFGIRYQVGVINYTKASPTLADSLRNIPSSLYYLLLCPPNFMARFPFLEMNGAAYPFGDPRQLPAGYFHEPVAGAFAIAPPLLAVLALPLLLWNRKRFSAGIRVVLGALAICGLAMLGAVCRIPSASARYELDFVPVLLIAGLFACQWLCAEAPRRWVRRVAMAAALAGCAWASLAGMALSVNSYGYPLEAPRSRTFRSIAEFFGAGPDALMNDVATLHLEAAVTFPRAEPEVRESLLAAGIYERWDLLYVEYRAGGKAVFAYVHSGVSDAASEEIPISPGVAHRLVVDYSAAAGRVTVRLDDRAVLDYRTTFFPSSRDRVTVGRIRAGRFGVRDFSGRIDAAPGGLQFVARSTARPKVFLPVPAPGAVRPVEEILSYELDGLVAHTAHMAHGKEPARPPSLPPGVFRITGGGDHFATAFQPPGAAEWPAVTAVEVTVLDRPYDRRFGAVNMVLQDQGYHTLYSSGSLLEGGDRAVAGLPSGTRSIRLAFLPNDEGFIVFPKLVRLRALAARP